MVLSGLEINVQGSTDCDRLSFSPVDCPQSSSGDEGARNNNNNDDADDDIDNVGNIEDQIPSVADIVPFP